MISAIKSYRVARWLADRGVPALPRLIDYINRLVFACWVPHEATIGRDVVLGYGGLGIVIHQDSVIGDRVHIDQGVTIGGNATEFGVARIGNDVYVGAGAKILGPITVGKNTRVGANSVVIQDVPAEMTVVGIPGRVVLPMNRRRITEHGIDLDHHLMPDPVGKAIACLLERITRLEAQLATATGKHVPAHDDCAVCVDGCDPGQVPVSDDAKRNAH